MCQHDSSSTCCWSEPSLASHSLKLTSEEGTHQCGIRSLYGILAENANHIFQIQATRAASRAAAPCPCPLPSLDCWVRGPERRISQANQRDSYLGAKASEAARAEPLCACACACALERALPE